MQLLLHLFLLVAIVASKKINLYARPIDQESTDPIGFIQDDSVYLMDYEIQPNQSYCIGTKDLHNHECFSFQRELPPLKNAVFHYFLAEDGDIIRLALSFDEQIDKPIILKHQHIEAPKPDLNSELLAKEREEQQKQAKKGVSVKKVKQKKMVTFVDTNGKEETREIEEEVEVEVDNRSWIQKNWMYIVPPLIIMLLMGGNEEKK
ncbi:hypothetical protein KGF56_000254 [Candida oxycetoniae]|uniref:ER membrane protein complex subunit 10 n=1 Tax=Candida oxycetoniae TaxID=497107 RepID=A0AAI9T246_9ASCO|nr:uncharacterized protein KGF56_000254 [Candida oxycetoniae]KAI3406961.1 hypothetical protein KGF56_000254 [Candida oxycetoniae]